MKNNKKICFYMIAIFLFTSCYIGDVKVQNYKTQEFMSKSIKTYISEFEITGKELYEKDKILLSRNIIFLFEKGGVAVEETVDNYDGIDYIMTIKLDVTSIGYDIFLMRNTYNLYFEIIIKDKYDDILNRIVSNNRIYFSPKDIVNSINILRSSISKARKSLRDNYKKGD